MTAWTDVKTKIDGIKASVETLNGDASTAGSIAEKQAIVTDLEAKKDALVGKIGGTGGADVLDGSADSLKTHVDSATNYLSGLGDASTGILKDMDDALGVGKTAYNDYVTSFNNYNDPSGTIQTNLGTLTSDVTDLADYTEVDVTGLTAPTSVDPFTALTAIS